MLIFCKSRYIKSKKYVFSCKIDKIFAQTNVIALIIRWVWVQLEWVGLGGQIDLGLLCHPYKKCNSLAFDFALANFFFLQLSLRSNSLSALAHFFSLFLLSVSNMPKSISNKFSKTNFGEQTHQKLTPTASLKAKLFQTFFWSCYSRSLNLENTVATPNDFFSIKDLNNRIKKNSFSLLSSLCFSLFASLSKNVSHNPNTKHKTKSNSYNKVELEQANMKKK